jgi:hypothetical protein
LDSPPGIYRLSEVTVGSPLRQGELLTNVVFVRLDLATLSADSPGVQRVTHPYALILTQDCDLEQDFRARQGVNKPDKLIPAVLLCEVITAEQLRGSTGITTDIWKGISQNKNERYHFLQKIEPACDACREGLPELGIDFKRYFTLPTDELYRRIEMGEARRRCVLASPYLEHLSSRFAYFMSRVALPEDHFSEPGGLKPR